MRALVLILPVASLVATSLARAEDPPAIVELKAGYALRQQGDCRGALPHLLASYRLDPKPKAILNASDCEERIGDLVSAEKHAMEGLELARREGDTELVGVARDQLASIDKRMPYLAITLAHGVPPDTTILHDGLAVDPATLGAATPAHPGAHTIIVRASGHTDRTYDLSLAEAQRRDIVVDVGELATPSELPANPYAEPSPHPQATDRRPSGLWETITLSPRNEIGAGLVVLGAVGVFVGGAFGIAAISSNAASNSNGHCDMTGCDPIGVQLRNTALSDATISTALFGVGLAAVGGGLVLYLTGPKTPTVAAHVDVIPLASPSMGGLGLRGSW